MNCNPATFLNQSIPKLIGADDPLISAVDVLIAAARQRDRNARVQTLLAGLAKAKGREAGPLLLALERRAVIVARNATSSKAKVAAEQRKVPDVGNSESVVGRAVFPFLKSDSASLRELAAYTIGSVLDALPRKVPPRTQLLAPPAPTPLQVESARALEAALATTGTDIASRVAMIEARALAGGEWVGSSDVQQAELRKLPFPYSPSNAEAAARYRALAKNPAPWRKDEVVKQYQALLLDAPDELQSAVGRALVTLDMANAANLISQRLARKDDAGLDVSTEIDLIARLPAATAATALLAAWNRPLNANEQLAFARACLRAADARLVPALSALLDPRQWNVRLLAVNALLEIDTDEAASVLRLHLDEEVDPARKLHLIAFLARHNIHDGDNAALESLADASLSDDAINAVVAAGAARVAAELERIWQTSNDPTSNAAAFRALARLGRQDIAARLLEIAKTPGDPLAQPALLALADLGSAEALPIVADALASRRDATVLNAARAAVTLLRKPNSRDDKIRDRLASLLSDADASSEVRTAALDALVSLDDPGLLTALNVAARDVSLEGTPLLAKIEAALETRPENP